MIGLYLSFSPRPSALVIADLGCSSGPNTFFAVSELIKTVENLRRKMGHDDPPVYQVFLNDLPGNDFNAVFRALPSSQDNQAQCFFAGVPGSFYGRLFPSKTLHFVHSSYSLHWLSQVMACPMYFSLLCLKEKKKKGNTVETIGKHIVHAGSSIDNNSVNVIFLQDIIFCMLIYL